MLTTKCHFNRSSIRAIRIDFFNFVYLISCLCNYLIFVVIQFKLPVLVAEPFRLL